MAITELDLTPGKREADWVLNVQETEASTGIVLREAIPDYRYGIKSVRISAGEDEKWMVLKNGDDDFIGPFCLSKYVPFSLEFPSTVYGDTGEALSIQTETDFPIYLCIRGVTCRPIPSVPFNPSPAYGATDVATNATLSWDSVYESVQYMVYLGTTLNTLAMVSDQAEKTYSPALADNTTYYWRVDEYLGGDSARGNLWTFST
jgi:hypothetical protein